MKLSIFIIPYYILLIFILIKVFLQLFEKLVLSNLKSFLWSKWAETPRGLFVNSQRTDNRRKQKVRPATQKCVPDYNPADKVDMMCGLTSDLYISKKNQYFCTTSKNDPVQAFEMQKRHTTFFLLAATDEWSISTNFWYELSSAGRKKWESASLSPIAVIVWTIIVIIETLFLHSSLHLDWKLFEGKFDGLKT